MFRRRKAHSTVIDVDLDRTIEEAFPNCAALVHEAISGHRRRYRRQALRYFIWFRLMGTAEIVFSLSLPVLALVGTTFLAVNDSMNNFFVAVVSILVALVAALQKFFRWHENWQLFRTQELSFNALFTDWKLAMVQLIEGDPEDRRSEALQRTGAFLSALNDSLRGEHDTFADTVSGPEVPRLSQTGATLGG